MVRETEAISTQVTNQDTVMCDITLSLVAPTFTLQPRDNQRLIQLAPTASVTRDLSGTPTAVGLPTLAFTAGNANKLADRPQRHEWQWVRPLSVPDLRLSGDFFGFLLTLASLVAWQWWPNRRTRTPKRTEAAVGTPSPPADPAVSSPEPARIG